MNMYSEAKIRNVPFSWNGRRCVWSKFPFCVRSVEVELLKAYFHSVKRAHGLRVDAIRGGSIAAALLVVRADVGESSALN